MLAGILALILAAPATPLAPATKPPSSRDVGRLVNEATTIEEALATARLLPRAGEETQHWETQDVHIARRRKSLTALLRRVTRWTVGGAAAEARRGVLANDDFRRCMHLLAEAGPAEAYAAERRDGLRLVAALAQAPDALAPVAQDVDAAFRVALDELDGAPGATTGLNWAAKRCAAAGVPVATLDALGAAERALSLPFRVHVNAVSLPGVDELAAALPLRADTIATKSGALVLERRRTAWLAEPGIGALAYSGEVSRVLSRRQRSWRRVFRAGKLMAPEPIPDAVRRIRDSVQRQCINQIVAARVRPPDSLIDLRTGQRHARRADLRLRFVQPLPGGRGRGMQVPQRPRARLALAPVDGRRIMWGAEKVRLPKDRGGR